MRKRSTGLTRRSPWRRTRDSAVSAVRVWGRLLRRSPREPGDISYRHQVVTGHVPLLALLAFPIEILLLTRLSPWPWLMWTLIAASAVAYAWLVALYASFFVLPHRLGASRLDLHFGMVDHLLVPIDTIERVALDIWEAPVDWDGLHRSDDGFVVSLPVANRTQVAVQLRTPHAVGGETTPTARVIRFAADDPEHAARLIASRIDSPSR